VREVVCSLNSNACGDQAILIELLWKVVVKLVDTGIKVHRQRTDTILEAEKQYLRKKSASHHR
jgi:hypothetical protein